MSHSHNFDTEAIAVPLEQKGFQDFSAALAAGGIPHQVVERGDSLCVMVRNEHYATAVKAAWNSWQNGVQWKVVKRIDEQPFFGDENFRGAQQSVAGHTASHAKTPITVAGIKASEIPVTLLILMLSLFGYLLVILVRKHLMPLESFMFFTWSHWPEVLYQPWRIVTPIFLHFSLLHIAFNSLWWWELGKSIERQLGSINLLALTVLMAFLSNFAQAMETMEAGFGGLSGVVYGLLGFNWLLAKLGNRVKFNLPPAVMPLMVAWLILCYTDIFTMLGIANIANAAHLAGLLSGLALAVIYHFWNVALKIK